MRKTCVLVLACLIPLTRAAGVSLYMVDDFEDGSAFNWAEGPASPNPPTVLTNGGPAGENDSFLNNISAGGGGAGSRQIMLNRDQWTGDFVVAGVLAIQFDIANLSGTNTDLEIRIAFARLGTGTRYVSNGLDLADDGSWQHFKVKLASDNFTRVSGADDFESVLSDVQEFRILSAEEPGFMGDSVASVLGFDNITAVPEPSALGLLLSGGMICLVARRGGVRRRMLTHSSTGPA